jgi:putative flippase GtrA
LNSRSFNADRIDLQGSARQAVRFLVVGLANTLVDAALYFALSSGAVIFVLPKLAAKAAGYLGGLANSYFWNRRWTFRSDRPVSLTLVPFVAANLAGMALNVALLHIGLHVFRLHEITALAAATAGVFLWNFAANKRWVFPKM